MLESLFIKVTVLRACNFIKETPTQVFSCEFCQLFKNIYLIEDLQTVGSETPVRGSFFDKVAGLTT